MVRRVFSHVPLSSVGEEGIIEALRHRIRYVDPAIRVGIGDDAAAVKFPPSQLVLVTTDMLIEGVHFLRNEPAFWIGHKALAASLSDIAAMGGRPRFALVSMGLPPQLRWGFLKEVYRGMQRIAERFSVSIIGGDTVRSPQVVINVCLLGQVEPSRLVLRSGARVADVIFVTGVLGEARFGRHLRFQPRLKEAEFLAGHFRPHAMIDLSDGLAKGITCICQESKVGALISSEKIPSSKRVGSWQEAIYEGEDFELLFTISPSQARRLKETPLPGGCGLTQIGKIVSRDEGLSILDSSGRKIPIVGDKGFRHF